MKDAQKSCELCGGNLSAGSRVTYSMSGELFLKPVAHPEGDRHLRQIGIQARVLAGEFPVPGTTRGYGYSGDFNCASWLSTWYRQHVDPLSTSCPWVSSSYLKLPGLPQISAWVQVDGIQEALSSLTETVLAEHDAAAERGWTSETRERRQRRLWIIEDLTTAALNARTHRTPWWEEIRKGRFWSSLPRWIHS